MDILIGLLNVFATNDTFLYFWINLGDFIFLIDQKRAVDALVRNNIIRIKWFQRNIPIILKDKKLSIFCFQNFRFWTQFLIYDKCFDI